MFFKKRREAAKAKAEESRQQTLHVFDEKFEDALKNADPAAKVLQLENMRDAIETLSDTLNGKTVSESRGKWLLGYLGGVVGANIAFDAVSILVTGVPASVLLVLPSIVIGLWSGDKRVEMTRQRMQKENAPLLAALEEKKKAADREIEKTLGADMRAFASSPQFGELLERVPSLRTRFAEAFRRDVSGRDLLDGTEPRKDGRKPGGFHI